MPGIEDTWRASSRNQRSKALQGHVWAQLRFFKTAHTPIAESRVASVVVTDVTTFDYHVWIAGRDLLAPASDRESEGSVAPGSHNHIGHVMPHPAPCSPEARMSVPDHMRWKTPTPSAGDMTARLAAVAVDGGAEAHADERAVAPVEVDEHALQRRAGPVLVEDEVAHRVDDQLALVLLDALRPVGMVAQHHVGARVNRGAGDVCWIGRGILGVLDAPVEVGNDQVGLLARGGEIAGQRDQVYRREAPACRGWRMAPAA